MSKFWANSGDSHLVEPADLFTTGLPADLAARMPRSVKDDDGGFETVHVDGQQFRRRMPRANMLTDEEGRTVDQRAPGANDMKLKVLAMGTAEESLRAYDDRRCDVLTSDVSQLYAERLRLSTPDGHIILPEVISKEPLGPAVRQGDDRWFNLIKWILYSLINAEELGVKSTTIEDAMKSSNPNIRRLVGIEGEFGEQLGLTNDWAVRAVRAVGNYGEIYERNVGTQSRLSIPRGLNALWTQGGIQYAPPIR